MLNLLFWLTLCLVIHTLLFSLLSLIGKGVGLVFPSVVRIVNYFALSLSLVWIGISLYGILFGWKKVSVDRITVSSDRIPKSFNDYKIVQLSDFHIGTYASAHEDLFP